MLNERGHEVVSDVPVAAPIRIRRPTQFEEMRRMIREEMSRQARSEGRETFEEADDFNVGEDYDPRSPWELDDEQLAASQFVEERPIEQPGELSTGAPPTGLAPVGNSGSPGGTGDDVVRSDPT